MDKCPHCGMTHETTCHRIKAIEHYENGNVRRIEFHGPPQVLSGGQLAGAAPCYEPSREVQVIDYRFGT